MPDRRFKVTFKDGTTETVKADSLDEAWAKARRSARKQISVGHQGRKQVAGVKVEPGQATPPRVTERGKRCSSRHPMYGKQVRCEERAGHSGDHFNSFYMRRWD